jgi:small subunit ribosomal protein S6
VKRSYETVIVYDGTLPDDVLSKEQTQIEEVIKQGATFEKTDVWGKRTLAYSIRKKRLGFYCLFLYEAEGPFIATLERPLKLNERVLRFLTVVRDPKVESKRQAFFARREKAIESAQARPVTQTTDEESAE